MLTKRDLLRSAALAALVAATATSFPAIAEDKWPGVLEATSTWRTVEVACARVDHEACRFVDDDHRVVDVDHAEGHCGVGDRTRR